MPLINLYTTHQPKVNRKKQEALLVAWLFITTKERLFDESTHFVRTGEQLKAVKELAATLGKTVYYIDMRTVYRRLRPLTPEQVEDLLKMAKKDPMFARMAKIFWNQGADILNYRPVFECLACKAVLQLNLAAD